MNSVAANMPLFLSDMMIIGQENNAPRRAKIGTFHHSVADFSVVVPTRGSQENITRTVHMLEGAFRDTPYEVVFVDRGNEDSSQQIAYYREHGVDIHIVSIDAATECTLLLEASTLATGHTVCFLSPELTNMEEAIRKVAHAMNDPECDLVVVAGAVSGPTDTVLVACQREVLDRELIVDPENIIATLLTGADQSRVFRIPYSEKSHLPEPVQEHVTTQPVKQTQKKVQSKATSTFIPATTQEHVIAKREHNKRERRGLWIFLGIVLLMIFITSAIVFIALKSGIGGETIFQMLFMGFALLLCTQGLFALFLMLYTWEDPERMKRGRSPKEFAPPEKSFTVMIPVRHEEAVIGQTLATIASVNYPTDLVQILVICSDDDTGTIRAVAEANQEIGAPNIHQVVYDAEPTCKPNGLNHALAESTGDVVVIFDGEDEPHRDILNVVNTVILRDGADVVQSGVQLMDYRSHWFSMFNVMEYYFWFKSSLHFFAKSGMMPLGGNTVFFDRTFLERVGGWDNYCLTEDADIGIRMCNLGAKTSVVYDEKHTTREETPPTVASFIKQRTRWSHGFLQILLKGAWLKLPRFHQKFLACYLTLWPLMHALLFLYIPISIWFALTHKIPAYIAVLVNLPLLIVLMHFAFFLLGLWQFTRDYKLTFPIWMPLKALIFYIPYQVLLGLGAFRALWRLVKGDLTWEKTEHTNAHRTNTQKTQTVHNELLEHP